MNTCITCNHNTISEYQRIIGQYNITKAYVVTNFHKAKVYHIGCSGATLMTSTNFILLKTDDNLLAVQFLNQNQLAGFHSVHYIELVCNYS